jgi:hypothetical protein
MCSPNQLKALDGIVATSNDEATDAVVSLANSRIVGMGYPMMA